MSIELPPGTANYSNSTPPPKNSQLLVLLGLFLGTIVAVVALFLWLANSLVWFVPPSVEQQIGRAVVPIFEVQAEPSETQDSLNQLLNRLEKQLPAIEAKGQNQEPTEERDYQVLYVPDKTVNALAIPGDRIIIYQGLLAEVHSENELMMVLGHELGHFAHRDHLRGLTRQIAVRLALGMLFGDAGAVGAIATNSISTLSSAQFSQGQERQADEVGLTLLQQTYGHAAGATDFFSRLMEPDIPGMSILASHPPSKSRVRNIERLIQQRGYTVKEKTDLRPALTAALTNASRSHAGSAHAAGPGLTRRD
jgi:predicted Zn-dependent protease